MGEMAIYRQLPRKLFRGCAKSRSENGIRDDTKRNVKALPQADRDSRLSACPRYDDLLFPRA